MEKELISIIVPVYNAERFIEQTINTVLRQTYKKWELILVDDKSTDNSIKIINKYIQENNNIKLIQNENNSGAAVSRNKGIDAAKGEYIAFLDADDLWKKDKLEKQLKFMKEKKCAFSFTGYEFANEEGIGNGKRVKVPYAINYKQALKNTTISTITVMLDMKKFSKKDDIYMPNIKSEDTACWWKILKNIDKAYGLEEVTAYYRRTQGTLSANKLKAIERIWNLYRKQEKLNIYYSIYNFCWYAFNAVKRRI